MRRDSKLDGERQRTQLDLMEKQAMKKLVIPTLTLLLSPLVTAAAAEEKVRIVTGYEQPTKCISRVEINSIDNQEVRVPPLEFRVEPGAHSITGRAVINTRFCRTIGNRSGKQKVEPLEADFEAGKVYYVGYDHSSADRKDWGLVIWKVEEEG
jgi:hypothetical protein